MHSSFLLRICTFFFFFLRVNFPDNDNGNELIGKFTGNATYSQTSVSVTLHLGGWRECCCCFCCCWCLDFPQTCYKSPASAHREWLDQERTEETFWRRTPKYSPSLKCCVFFQSTTLFIHILYCLFSLRNLSVFNFSFTVALQSHQALNCIYFAYFKICVVF